MSFKMFCNSIYRIRKTNRPIFCLIIFNSIISGFLFFMMCFSFILETSKNVFLCLFFSLNKITWDTRLKRPPELVTSICFCYWFKACFQGQTNSRPALTACSKRVFSAEQKWIVSHLLFAVCKTVQLWAEVHHTLM